eukprot:TRINITY_DN7584_c1_g2_i1.p1 TRINITY_DN7584_c1_g2~~TRINITY_DN7584_c1_g2_i1.p1  ORF type:complete len:235 (-),score=41.97 TRINITY_DN7584_c1_g2_i1:520-1224(-)
MCCNSNMVSCSESVLTAVHVAPSPAAHIEKAILKLLQDCFPEQEQPDQLEDVLGFFEADSCHWILLVDKNEGPSWTSPFFSQKTDAAVVVSGCVCCVFLPKAIFINALAVAPEVQGRGLGTRLLLEAQKLAIRSGKARLEGSVDVCGSTAERLRTYYGRLGGEEVPLQGFGSGGSADVTKLRLEKTWDLKICTEKDVDEALLNMQRLNYWRTRRFGRFILQKLMHFSKAVCCLT